MWGAVSDVRDSELDAGLDAELGTELEASPATAVELRRRRGWEIELNQINRAPYRYTGNTPVSTAGVALRGYPATVTFVTASGNGMGPRIRWGVACTPTETGPRVEEKPHKISQILILHRAQRPRPHPHPNRGLF